MNPAIRRTVKASLFGLALLSGSGGNAQTTPLEPVQVVFDALTLPREIAAPPDGKHIYVAAGDTIVGYERNLATGALIGIDVQRNRINGVNGLALIRSVAVSPDGAHVYGAASTDQAVTVFARDALTGILTFVEAHINGQNGVTGLGTANAVTVAPDGAHVYVAGRASAALAVFARNPATGALTFVESVTNGVNGVEGLAGAESVTVSADGAHVYAAGATDSALSVFVRNPLTGRLTFVEAEKDGVNGVDGLAGNWFVAVSPDDAHVYAAGSGEAAVAVFTRNPVTGALTFVEAAINGANGVDGLLSVESVTLSFDGAHLYAAGDADNALAVFARNQTTGALTFVEVVRDGVNGVTGMGLPRFAMVTPDGEHLYATSFQADGLARFTRSQATGALTFDGIVQAGLDDVDGLASVAAIAVSPDGIHAYAAGYDDDEVAAFARDAATGALTFIESYRDDVNGVDGLLAAAVAALAPDGAHLYAAGRIEPKMAVFARNGLDGTLTFVETLENGVNGVTGLLDTTSAIVSPDGAHVYSTGFADNAVAVFSRDALTGMLTFVEAQQDGVGGVDGLAGAVWAALSPDGAHLYAAGLNDNAVAVFSRDGGTGSLTFVEFHQDGIGGVDGLAAARHVAVSPDGAHVYVSGFADNAIAVFERNGATGALMFSDVMLNGLEGVEGLGGVSSVAVSSAGSWLYAAGYAESAVSVFSRDDTTGALQFEGVLRDDENGVAGLQEPQAVAISPDDGFVYAAGEGDHAVSVFRKRVVASLEGHVMSSAGGEALSCAIIELTTLDQSATYRAYTDLNGYYFFADREPGQYTVSAFGPGFTRSPAQIILLEPDAALVHDIFPAPNAEGPNIIGTVTDADTGIPLTGVRVEAIVNGQTLDVTYTCASGEFAFTLPVVKGASSVQLDFSLPHYFSETAEVTLDPPEPAVVDQPLQKQLTVPGTLAGIVYGPQGAKQDAPVAGAQVTAIGGSSNASVRTNANGVFLFDNLLAGAYTIRASKEGYLGASDQRFVSGGAVVQSILRLNEIPPPAPGALRVRIEPAAARAAGARWRVNGGPEQESDATVHGLGPGAATVAFTQIPGWLAPPNVDTVIASNETRALTRFYARRFDINGDYAVDAVDVQLVINGVLGRPGNFVTDVNESGAADAIDIQLVINAVLGIE